MRRYWEFECLEGFDALRIEILLERLIRHAELGEIWVAAAGEPLHGYLIVVHVLSLEHGGLMGEIDEFFVVTQARAQGVGATAPGERRSGAAPAWRCTAAAAARTRQRCLTALL